MTLWEIRYSEPDGPSGTAIEWFDHLSVAQARKGQLDAEEGRGCTNPMLRSVPVRNRAAFLVWLNDNACVG